MTPQESQLVTELFDRIEKLEGNVRDPDAEDLIAELWDRAPNAAYALVQTVLVQEEALKRANEYILQLESELGIQPEQQPQQGGSFLDSMREKMFGRGEPARGSVPSVRPGDQPMGAPDLRGGQSDPRWNTGATYQQQPQQQPQQQQPQQQPQQQQQQQPEQRSGGGFLGTAAAAAAGVVGGALLSQGISSLFGGQSGSAHAKAFDPGLSGGDQSSPWGGGGGGDLAKQAGLNDIGGPAGGAGATSGTGLFGGDNEAGDFDADADFGDDLDTGDFDVGDE